MERSVRRTELHSDSDTASSSPEPEIISTLPELHFVDNLAGRQEDEERQHEDEELEFRLFAPLPTQHDQGVQNIRVNSPTPEHHEPAFLQSHRPSAYYFATEIEGEKDALTDENVRRMAAIRWHGMAYPWKVLKLPATSQHETIRSQTDGASSGLPRGDSSNRRKRVGKKLRIKLRKRSAIVHAEQTAAKMAQEARDAADREKQTRKNREKKMKQKQRAKAKKAAAEGLANIANTGLDYSAG